MIGTFALGLCGFGVGFGALFGGCLIGFFLTGFLTGFFFFLMGFFMACAAVMLELLTIGAEAAVVVVGAAAKAPIHAIASYGAKLDTECVAAPGYNTGAKLRGQNVGTTGAAGFAATTLAACLRPLGLTLADVHPVIMTRSQFVGALATGAIKVASFHADDAYVVLHQIKGSTVVDKEYQTLPKWWYGGVSSLDSYTKTHPVVTEHFLAALILANNWMNNPKNFKALVNLTVRATGEDKAAVTYALRFNLAAKSFTTTMNPASVMWTAKECKVVGDTTVVPTYNQIVDNHFLLAAQKLVKSQGNG